MSQKQALELVSQIFSRFPKIDPSYMKWLADNPEVLTKSLQQLIHKPVVASMQDPERILMMQIIQSLPHMSNEEMQRLIEKPSFITPALKSVVPTLEKFWEVNKPEGFNLIRLHPNWDFMILQAKDYPEIGIAVSNSPSMEGSVGQGWKITLFGKHFQQQFVCPCACCTWYNGLQFVSDDKEMHAEWNQMSQSGRWGMKYESYCGQMLGINLINQKCREQGINHLFLHCFLTDGGWLPKQCQGLTFTDPYHEKWNFNKDLFIQAFNGFLDF